MIDLFWTNKVLVDHGLWVGLLIFFPPLILFFKVHLHLSQMKAQTSVLNGIYSAFTLNKGFSLKDLVKCFNPGVSENLDEELLEGDFLCII